MKKLVRKQFLPIDLDTAWDYFSSPDNLNEITPEDMVFQTISEVPDKMYEGLFIVYRLKPMLNIPVKWVTEITHVVPKKFFVDEQRKGPYNIWHHELHFEEKISKKVERLTHKKRTITRPFQYNYQVKPSRYLPVI